MNPVLEAIFGNGSAMRIFLFLENYGEGHASRIASTFDIALTGVQRQLKRLEADSVLVSVMVGNIRVYRFNARNPTVKNLQKFLSAELQNSSKQDKADYYRQRQRPRRAGKSL